MSSRRHIRPIAVVFLSMLLVLVLVSVAYAYSVLGRSQLDPWCKVQLSRSDAYAVFESSPFPYGWHCYGPSSPPGTQWEWLNADAACQYYGHPSAIGWNENGVYCND